MPKLTELKCIPCRGGEPPLGTSEIDNLLLQVPGWTVTEHDGIPRLERAFKFPDFKSALAFTQQIGELAEAEDHHPAILTEWGRVTISWWTHKIRGLHNNDFIMAAKTSAIYPQ
jgi:4a-hydroxytetrahydrobiopterin dehydratase